MKFYHIILIVCIFLLAFFAGYVGLNVFKYKENPFSDLQNNQTFITRDAVVNQTLQEELLTKINTNEEVLGDILITTLLKESNPELQRIQTYAYSALENSIVKIDAETPVLYPYKNNVTKGYIFAAWPEDAEKPSLFDISSTTEKFTPLPGSSNIGDTVVMRLPRVSEDGKNYLFSAQTWADTETPPDYADINSWKTFVGSLENPDVTSEYFADGYGAQFTVGGKYIVYVKENGVFAKKFIEGADHSLEVEVPLLFEDFKYALRNQIDISSNGEYLAVSYPIDPVRGNSSVDIFKLSFDDSDSMKSSVSLVERIALEKNISAFWPIFSPEGRYISFQTSTEISPVSFDNKLAIYDLLEKKYVQFFDFNNFDFNMSFNTDWVSDFNQ